MRITSKNPNKFSWEEITSNPDGKTSATTTMAIMICTIGTLCFLAGCIIKMINPDGNIDVITQSIVFVGIGAGLLGYKKSQEKVLFPAGEYAPNPDPDMPDDFDMSDDPTPPPIKDIDVDNLEDTPLNS